MCVQYLTRIICSRSRARGECNQKARKENRNVQMTSQMVLRVDQQREEKSNRISWCPSWIHIELCAVRRSLRFGRFWRISGSCASLPIVLSPEVELDRVVF